MGTVSVNRGLLAGLVGLSAASLLALAFLLGRSCASGPPSGPPAGRAGEPVAVVARGAGAEPREAGQQPAAQVQAGPGVPDGASVPPAPVAAPSVPWNRAASQASAASAASAAPGAAAAAAAPVAAVVAPVLRGGSASDPAAAGVAAYLDTVDGIQPGKMSGSAESVAGEMAAALAKGDTSSLDRLIQQTEAAKERLASLVPPAACAAHHAESLGSLDDAVQVLRSLKKAMESSDPAAELAAVASRASALRTRSEALQKEELSLRQRFNLVR